MIFNTQSRSRLVLVMAFVLLALAALSACTSAETEEPADPNTLTGIVWQWVSVTNQTTRTTEDVPSPENYTLVLNTDGTFTGTADCNNFAGTYSQEGGFSFQLGPTTMAFCGEASLDVQYLDLLASVVAGGPDGQGNLALETPGGEQRMIFQNGGAASN